MKKKNRTIPTIIGIFTLTITLAVGLLLVRGKQLFKLQASGDITPSGVRITNITDSAFTVSWTTKKNVASFVIWGESIDDLKNTNQDELGSTGYMHSATITNLGSAKAYYFKINSDGNDYDNEGLAWQTTTGVGLESPAEPRSVSGTLLKATGTPESGALIFLSATGASPMSTVTSDNGSFVFPVSELRDSTLTGYFNFAEDAVIEISAQAGPDGTSSAQIKYSASENVPQMILGQVHDFKNLPEDTASTQEIPEANIEKPPVVSTDSGTSGFAVDNIKIATPSAKKVTLDSIENGETITSTKPEFFGKGPNGATVTITVNSTTPITTTVTVDSSGNWKWDPPKNLEPGNHKVTITWKDTKGVVQTLTKDFIVEAAEGAPAFVSTPSASTSATPVATLPPQPVSGFELPTLMLFLLAGALIVFGGTAFYLGM